MNKNIKGNTKLYAVIGNPITHTISPEIHNSIFDRCQSNSTYVPLKVISEVMDKVIYLLKSSFGGFNVTIPHKQEIMKHLDEIDDQALHYGAVNTVKIVNGKLKGFNTDGYGFCKSMEIHDIHVKGKKVLLLGTGGAARVAAFELVKKGAILTIANRHKEKAHKLKEELTSNLGQVFISSIGIDEVQGQYEGIVNATPVGMYPNTDQIPLSVELLEGVAFVLDMIYNPYETKLLRLAKEKGSLCVNGFSMLFYQAVKSQEIWTDTFLDRDMIQSVYTELERYLIEKFR